MWSILRYLLQILSTYENSPSKGYLYDDAFEKYASAPIKSYISEARNRLSKKDENPMCKLATTFDTNVALLAHPLHSYNLISNTAIYVYKKVYYLLLYNFLLFN